MPEELKLVNDEAGIRRFSGHKELYIKYLKKFTADSAYTGLCGAMEQGDYEEAFRCAHTLKGVVGNLSLDSFYGKLEVFVDMLRGEKDIPGAKEAFPAIKQSFEATSEAVMGYLAQQ